VARVFVTRPLPGDALDRLRAAGHEVEVWPDRLPPPPEALREQVADADALLSMLTDRVDTELLDAAPGLRAIANYAVGSDNIDLEAARARGIPVGVTPGVLTDATADIAFALILAIARRLPEGEAAVRAGEWLTWGPDWLLGRDVHGATLGIVGQGRIGAAVARRADGFGMTVVHHSRSSGIPLDELLARADFVSLHVPLTQETRHLIDAAALERMRPTAYLVNTARGGIVDQDALAAALHAGSIAGAALDVTEPEPLPPDHPLLDAPNLIVLPHLGSATHATREAMASLAVDNLLAALDGKPMPSPAS
jgi:glyoxylate reductase